MPPTPATVTAFWRPEMWASGAGISTTSSAVSPCTCDHERRLRGQAGVRVQHPLRLAARPGGVQHQREVLGPGAPGAHGLALRRPGRARRRGRPPGQDRAGPAARRPRPVRRGGGSARRPRRAASRPGTARGPPSGWRPARRRCSRGPRPAPASEPASRATASCERVRHRGRPRRRRRWRGPHPAPRRASVRCVARSWWSQVGARLTGLTASGRSSPARRSTGRGRRCRRRS